MLYIIPNRRDSHIVIAPWGGRRMAAYYKGLLEAVAEQLGVDMETPWRELPAKARGRILNGIGKQEIEFRVARRRGH